MTDTPTRSRDETARPGLESRPDTNRSGDHVTQATRSAQAEPCPAPWSAYSERFDVDQLDAEQRTRAALAYAERFPKPTRRRGARRAH